jgi:hypothetical protein
MLKRETGNSLIELLAILGLIATILATSIPDARTSTQ